jgi:hypothetical protein
MGNGKKTIALWIPEPAASLRTITFNSYLENKNILLFSKKHATF